MDKSSPADSFEDSRNKDFAAANDASNSHNNNKKKKKNNNNNKKKVVLNGATPPVPVGTSSAAAAAVGAAAPRAASSSSSSGSTGSRSRKRLDDRTNCDGGGNNDDSNKNSGAFSSSTSTAAATFAANDDDMDPPGKSPVDLRRVYTMPVRGSFSGNSRVSDDDDRSDSHPDDETDGGGGPTTTARAAALLLPPALGISSSINNGGGNKLSLQKPVLRHSKSDGDAFDARQRRRTATPGTAATTATATTASSSGGDGASSSPSPPPENGERQRRKRRGERQKIDEYGFIVNMDSTGNIPRAYSSDDDDDDDGSGDGSRIPTFSEAQRAERRVKKWQSALIRGGEGVSSSNGKDKRRTLFLSSVLPRFGAPSPSLSLSPPPPISTLAMGDSPTQFFAQDPDARHYHRNSRTRKPRRNKKIIRRARKGIPSQLRGRVWAHLFADVGTRMDQNEGLYDRLVRETIVLEDAGEDNGSPEQRGKNGGGGGELSDLAAINHTKSFRNLQDTIERDIHRTFPRHTMFHLAIDEEDSDDDEDLVGSKEISSMIQSLEKQQAMGVLDAKGGQASLRRILKAYSLYDREIGYCQGMNFIAAMFLTQMDEEESFWLLVGTYACAPFSGRRYRDASHSVLLHFISFLDIVLFLLYTAVMFEQPCRMRGLFGEGMHETHQVLYVAEKLIRQFLPRLSQHLDRENIHITMFATQWLLTQYTSSFKFDLVLRVWDCFLCEGWKITYRVMLAMLMEWQSDLLKMSFEEILAFFRDLPDRVDGGKIVDAAIRIQLKRKHVTKYEKEWAAQQASRG